MVIMGVVLVVVLGVLLLILGWLVFKFKLGLHNIILVQGFWVVPTNIRRNLGLVMWLLVRNVWLIYGVFRFTCSSFIKKLMHQVLFGIILNLTAVSNILLVMALPVVLSSHCLMTARVHRWIIIHRPHSHILATSSTDTIIIVWFAVAV